MSGSGSPGEAKARIEAARAKKVAKESGQPIAPARSLRAPRLFPENRDAWDVFLRMTTQARVAGMGGVVGFDYTPLPFVFRMVGVGRDDWAETFEKVRALEAFWVTRINSSLKKDKKTGGRE